MAAVELVESCRPLEQDGAAFELVAPHCDIAWRLPLVPPSATVRGMYMRWILGELERAGALEEYRRFYPNERWSAMRMYPLRDYLLRLALAGAVRSSPETLHEGIARLYYANATSFATSLLGRTMIRLLSRDPYRLSQQALAARRQTCRYGNWSMKRSGERSVVMMYEEEYNWIESAVGEAAKGTFEAVGIEVKVETVVTGPFTGFTQASW